MSVVGKAKSVINLIILNNNSLEETALKQYIKYPHQQMD